MKTQPVGGADGERRIAIVLASGDDIKNCVRSFASSIAATGHVNGIGAVRAATLAFWDPASQQYQKIEIREQAEVVALTGNVALTNGKYELHAHVVLGLRDGRAVGGHLIEAKVHPTLELVFVEATPALRREKDPETGLDLLVLAAPKGKDAAN